MESKLQFKISSALKNIIGRDLINDDFIAVFELVKNSYDAHSTKVEIIFENLKTEKQKIIIRDNGKGMNYEDLVNKWLFLAYSAKKEGTEEDNYTYRDKINTKRAYAGAKGIGRFSCDRLGSYLYLETKKNELNAKTEVLYTDWEKFESDITEEFIDISVIHDTIEYSNYRLNHGTVLEITNLRSTWDREKLLKLKSALAKLVNPNTKDSDDVFKISLIVDSELPEDNKVKEEGLKKSLTRESIYKDVVNGEVENLIFEALDIKTTKIISQVSDTQKAIVKTELQEGGKLVYCIVEENPLPILGSVDFTIYYLNHSSKSTFTRRMGVPPVDYGHIFIYKNGLRIYPYGERGEDPLKMDNRKAQGRTRFLGTREVIGYININGSNDELRETSSRGDGLIKTETYNALYEWFYTTLKRLEKYIIEVSDWGKDLSEDDYINLDENSKVLALQNIVMNLSKTKNIISIDYAPDLFQILESKGENSARGILSEIRQKIQQDNFEKHEILSVIDKAQNKISNLEKIKNEAEDDAFRELIKNESLAIELEKEIKKGSWKGALLGTDKERIIGLQHQIFHSSSRITRNLKLLLRELDPMQLNEQIRKYITVISMETTKIHSIANFITKANFNLVASEIEIDIVEFITEYINEIYISNDKIIDTTLGINIINRGNNRFVRAIRPLEITTLIDNFISNAEKAGAEKISFTFSKLKNNLVLEISDNAKTGIPKENISKIFDLGFTTTDGSGIGLFQVKDIVSKLKGTIDVESTKDTGTTFKITI